MSIVAGTILTKKDLDNKELLKLSLFPNTRLIPVFRKETGDVLIREMTPKEIDSVVKEIETSLSALLAIKNSPELELYVSNNMLAIFKNGLILDTDTSPSELMSRQSRWSGDYFEDLRAKLAKELPEGDESAANQFRLNCEAAMKEHKERSDLFKKEADKAILDDLIANMEERKKAILAL